MGLFVSLSEVSHAVEPVSSGGCGDSLKKARLRRVEPVKPSNKTREGEDEYDKAEPPGEHGRDIVEISEEARRRASGS